MLQASAVVVFASWACGGSYPWGPPCILALVALGLPIAFLRARHVGRSRWWPFVPAIAWLVFCGIAWLNPSYRALPNGSWLPQPFHAWLPATVDRTHTVIACEPWLAALLEGGVLVMAAPSHRAILWLWRVIACNGFVLAAVGAWVKFTGTEQMLGFIEPPEPTYFFATFFYKNHWAAFGALAGAVALSLVLFDWGTSVRGDPDAKGRVVLFGGAGLLTLGTLPLPGSRAGALLAIAIVATFLVLIPVALRRSRADPRRLTVSALYAAIALGVIGFAVDAYWPRAAIDLDRTRQELGVAADTTPNLRWSLSRDTWRMARDRPWFGWGPGSFEIVFPVYQGNYLRSADGRPEARIEDAHNDWLQLLAECGVIGASLIVLPFGVCLARGWKSDSYAARWIAAMCALVGIYALIDFPFRNPAVLMLCTVIVTTAYRLRNRTRIVGSAVTIQLNRE